MTAIDRLLPLPFGRKTEDEKQNGRNEFRFGFDSKIHLPENMSGAVGVGVVIAIVVLALGTLHLLLGAMP